MIGKVIREQRLAKQMTQKELAEGICSQKYIYLIERGERNPSAYILNQLSERLSIDLFEYYQYLEFENTSLVVEYKRKVDKYIQLGDVEKLKEKALKVAELEDFKHEPLSYELIIIKNLYQGVITGKTDQAKDELLTIFTKNLNINPRTLINGYVVLATCYQLEGKMDEAQETLTFAYEMVKDKKGFSRYHTVIGTVLIALTTCLAQMKNYKALAKYSEKLLAFQQEYHQYNRIYYAYFYLSFTHYQTKQLEQAKKYFMKGLHSALLFESKIDISVIIKMTEFNDLAEALEIDQRAINKLYSLVEKEPFFEHIYA